MLMRETSEAKRIDAYVTWSLSAIFAKVLSLWLLKSRRKAWAETLHIIGGLLFFLVGKGNHLSLKL